MFASPTAKKVRAIALAITVTFVTNYAISYAEKADHPVTQNSDRGGIVTTTSVPRPTRGGIVTTTSVPRPTRGGIVTTTSVPRPR
jgi:hypothetical protein